MCERERGDIIIEQCRKCHVMLPVAFVCWRSVILAMLLWAVVCALYFCHSGQFDFSCTYVKLET